MAHTANDAPRRGRPQGGAKSEAGRAAYWRMQWESSIGALADLIAEHTETVEAVRNVLREADDTWTPSQARAMFERLWDAVGRDIPPGETNTGAGPVG